MILQLLANATNVENNFLFKWNLENHINQVHKLYFRQTYLIFVIFFTRTHFKSWKFYTRKMRKFTTKLPKTVFFWFFWNFFTLSQKFYTHGVRSVRDKYQVWVRIRCGTECGLHFQVQEIWKLQPPNTLWLSVGNAESGKLFWSWQKNVKSNDAMIKLKRRMVLVISDA